MKRTFLIAALLLLTGCTVTDRTAPTSEAAEERAVSEETDAPETAPEPEAPTAEPAPEPKTVSFCAVGDNLIHSPIYYQAFGGGGYDFTDAYSGVADIIANADVAVINQETLICNDMYEPSNYPYFNSPTALGDHMMALGFDVFTLANNHCLDYGEQGLSYSLDYWDSRNAVTAGVYRNEEDKSKIRTAEFGGVTFSFLSYTESLNGLSLPADSEMIIGNANDLDGMISDIKAAKELSDVCVVALHWGVEGSGVIEDRQREYARELAEAGADIIIGNHPHVLRGIEMIERSDGETLCAYSLGNFISAQNSG
ncbi:MAG: CapA family protein, partial [Oscillospiraceae bacterium]|nr:CapA family protein [Oscillospiraceae bacterium]